MSMCGAPRHGEPGGCRARARAGNGQGSDRDCAPRTLPTRLRSYTGHRLHRAMSPVWAVILQGMCARMQGNSCHHVSFGGCGRANVARVCLPELVFAFRSITMRAAYLPQDRLDIAELVCLQHEQTHRRAGTTDTIGAVARERAFGLVALRTAASFQEYRDAVRLGLHSGRGARNMSRCCGI